ncbi:cadherin-24 isoform X2 [Macaca nemestrina]|uniref:cadherin-24 isoform X2 n=1 Tax=Macaca nemestrina TaxID=9545 RepID=UPI0039B8335B
MSCFCPRTAPWARASDSLDPYAVLKCPPADLLPCSARALKTPPPCRWNPHQSQKPDRNRDPGARSREPGLRSGLGIPHLTVRSPVVRCGLQAGSFAFPGAPAPPALRKWPGAVAWTSSRPSALPGAAGPFREGRHICMRPAAQERRGGGRAAPPPPPPRGPGWPGRVGGWALLSRAARSRLVSPQAEPPSPAPSVSLPCSRRGRSDLQRSRGARSNRLGAAPPGPGDGGGRGCFPSAWAPRQCQLHSDVDRGEGRTKYLLTGEGAGTVFVIDEATGNIHVTKSLDREEKAQYVLLAQAVDRASNRPLEPPSEFIIKVQDINDNPPIFPLGPYHATVPEMSNVGTSVIQVTAHDADDPSYGNSAKLVYTVLDGLPFFSVDPQTGVVRTAIPNMDRETQEEFLVVIQAKDMGGHMGGLSGSTTVTVTLSDVNDNPPKFPQSLYQFSVVETAGPGTLVGRLRAQDPDLGDNALMAYSILDGEGSEAFSISTDSQGRDGLLTVRKPLDFESRRSYAFRVEATNTLIDPAYLRRGPFKDVASVRVVVQDAPEPPAFTQAAYHLTVPENKAPGTLVGQISAADLDSPASPIRYSILPHSDPDRCFSIQPEEGTIHTAAPLDREARVWHNLTVLATELDSSAQASRVQVTIQTLDENDNAPQLAEPYDTFVCDSAAPGQLIQVIQALDRDEVGNSSHVSFQGPLGPDANFTVRDNRDGSASLLLPSRPAPPRQAPYLVPIELWDWGQPALSSTATVTVSVCRCQPDGSVASCWPEAHLSAAGLSTGALLAIITCVGALLALVVLFVALRRQKQEALMVLEEEDVRENIITYDDEGGGEEDTEAFDITALQNPDGAAPQAPGPPARRDVLPRARVSRQPRPPGPADVAQLLVLRLREADEDPSVPPYDSVQVYGYEGRGSSCGSLSSLGSGSEAGGVPGPAEPLDDWGPLFRTLAELYGAKEPPAP